MSKCNGNCNANALLLAFSQDEAATGIDQDKITTSIVRLCAQARQAGKALCALEFGDVKAYVHNLYSLEDTEYTMDDSREEIFIATRFYDYLLGRGCLALNPLRALKAAAVKQLLERLEERGYGKEIIEEHNKLKGKGDKDV